MKISPIHPLASWGLVLFFAASLVAYAPPVASGPFDATLASPDLSLSFPKHVSENESLELATSIAAGLDLGLVLSSEVTVTDATHVMIDALNNSVPASGDPSFAIPRRVVKVPTEGDAEVQLHYTFTKNASGTFLFAEIWLDPLALGSQESVGDFLRDLSSSLGIILHGDERFYSSWWTESEYTQGNLTKYRVTDAAFYGLLRGKPVEFANQVRLTTWETEGANKRTGRIFLFPWIEEVQPPSLSEEVALITALGHINSTYNLTHWSLGGWKAQFALDARGYRIAHSFHVLYPGEDDAYYGTKSFVVWVDAQDGRILLSQSAHAVPAVGVPVVLPVQYILLVGVIGLALVGVVHRIRAYESARFVFFWALGFPFYRLGRERALEHFTRGRIHEYVRTNPGATFSDIRDFLALNNGAAAYHLMVLEKTSLLASRKEGKLKRFFLVSAPEGVVEPRLSRMQYEIMDALASKDKTQAELARELHVSRQRISYNVKRLRKRGLMSLRDDGRTLTLGTVGRAVVGSRAREDLR